MQALPDFAPRAQCLPHCPVLAMAMAALAARRLGARLPAFPFRAYSAPAARGTERFEGVNFITTFGGVLQDLCVTWECWGEPTLGPERTVSAAGIARLPSRPGVHEG